jgi:hypothetical protein
MYSPYIEGITKNIPIVGSDYSVIPESMQVHQIYFSSTIL